jgi:hypothetical protein
MAIVTAVGYLRISFTMTRRQRVLDYPILLQPIRL